MNRRAWPLVAGILGLVVVAFAAVMLSHQPTAPLDTRVDRVARTLRCPTCAGESVAASDTPMARSMREEIRHQLAAGRSPDHVRSWFVGRYGNDIVTTPARTGPGLILWLVPICALGVGLLLVLAWPRRRRPSVLRGSTMHGDPHLSGRRLLCAFAVCVAAGTSLPVALALPSSGRAAATSTTGPPDTTAAPSAAQWTRLGRVLDRQGDPVRAERAYRRSLAADPRNARSRTRLAFDLLRDGRLRSSVRLVRPVAESQGPHRALGLLVLGLAQRGLGEASAASTLRTFLRVAPGHPAALQVRRLLRGR